jgi:hypothetical protein
MNTTHALSTKSGGLRRKITSVLVALGVVATMIGATTTPTHAATSVRGCFNYGSNWHRSPLWDTPVELLAYQPANNSWAIIGRSKLGANGCQSFTLTGGYTGFFLLMRVASQANGGVLRGTTPSFAYPGTGHYELGTGQVTFSRY